MREETRVHTKWSIWCISAANVLVNALAGERFYYYYYWSAMWCVLALAIFPIILLHNRPVFNKLPPRAVNGYTNYPIIKWFRCAYKATFAFIFGVHVRWAQHVLFFCVWITLDEGFICFFVSLFSASLNFDGERIRIHGDDWNTFVVRALILTSMFDIAST